MRTTTQVEIETYFENDEWRNAVVPGEDVGGTYAERDRAVAEGRRLADERGVEHVIRDEHGTIVERSGAH